MFPDGMSEERFPEDHSYGAFIFRMQRDDNEKQAQRASVPIGSQGSSSVTG